MSTTTSTDTPAEVKTDVFIVGAGPAGAGLADFLSYYGIKVFMISRNSTTAPQPRAHYTNQGAWECLRDIGLEPQLRQVAMPKEYYGDYPFSHTLSGPDLLRMRSFGLRADRLGDYQMASPCEHADVSQNVMEPHLINYASLRGAQIRFDCKFLRFDEDEETGLITSTVEDQVTKTVFHVVSKYVCGADGGSSYVARQLNLPFHTLSTGGVALNVWYEADLSHIYEHKPSMLHAVSMPLQENPSWCARGVNRTVKPYTEFIMSVQAELGAGNTEVGEEDVLAQLKKMIGDDTVEIRIKGIYRWRINESYAEVTSKGNVFCLGDAIHRHPPGNGLGSNTCIQDAYNLAWKLAYVIQGKAGPELLDSYNMERQPIAKRIVRIANDTFRLHYALYTALGLFEPSVEKRRRALEELEESSPAGVERRAALAKAREAMYDEVTGLGAELNQAYISKAVCHDDESDAGPGWEEGSAGVRYHTISTYPGSRLPHAWLQPRDSGARVSTHDVAGKGAFALFTGVGGAAAWQAAALAAQKATGVEIAVRSIGPGQGYQDMYDMWAKRRGVEEAGAVLVRPDRTVAWRSKRLAPANCNEELTKVMRKVLALAD